MAISVTPASKTHPLDGARERLKRADENIGHLNTEVSQFLASIPRAIFKPGPDGNMVISDENREAYQAIRESALAQQSMPRLSVLAGEIIHHFRSALDHVMWQLASAEHRRKFESTIEFPVCEKWQECFIRESDREVKHSAYCRKVQGLTSIAALTRIYWLQPYHRADLFNSPLLQIHLLDKFDKHRELVEIASQPFLRAHRFEQRVVNAVINRATGEVLRFVGPAEVTKVDVHAELFIDVAFTELRKWETQPLIVFLEKLLRFTSDTVESFAGEFG